MTANQLTQSIITYLNAHPSTLVWRNVANRVKGRTFTGRKGVGDIVGVSNGRHIEIEVKVGRDFMKPEQEQHRDEIRACGAWYFVARDLDGFIRDWDQAHKEP